MEGLPVTVVYSMEEANYSQIKNMADHLRRFMQYRLVPCVSQLICRDTFSGKGTEEIMKRNGRPFFWNRIGQIREKSFGGLWIPGDIKKYLKEIL